MWAIFSPDGLDINRSSVTMLLRLILNIDVWGLVMDRQREDTCSAECGLRMICRCLRVTEEVLVQAFASGDIRTLKDIRRHTGAGDGCMACHRRLASYLERFTVPEPLAAAVA
jgi:bacterioferritin-associated ferredoxin